jgi:hypothetical protein
MGGAVEDLDSALVNAFRKVLAKLASDDTQARITKISTATISQPCNSLDVPSTRRNRLHPKAWFTKKKEYSFS